MPAGQPSAGDDRGHPGVSFRYLSILDAVLDRAPCGFVSFADDGTILEVNTTLATLLGYSRAELAGWHLQKILPPGGRIFYQTHVFPILKMHGVAEEIYIALRAKDGTDVPVLMNGVRCERDGAQVNECVFVRMIQRHQYEDQLLQARRLAEEANAARAKFLSMMSHDLRTPLTSITGHASLIAAGLRGPVTEEQSEGLARIRDAGQELLRMINDILNFAKLESGSVDVRLEPVKVADAVARASSLVYVRLSEEMLAFDAAGCNGEEVLADPDRLQQVLLNLLTNAIKYTPAGGRISVSCARDGSRVLLHVRD
ncbi:MAG TPA: PAS domain-containing sensor histidine kinase, partial [Thermoanaerobaculia bacterium]|nr:PAS domain-containing sensor histidine kinase [Thermoanaerobaculia bacterium]